MRTCYVFVDEVPADEGVRVVPDEDNGRVFVLMSPDLARDDPDHLARLLSLAMSRHVQASWLYVGAVSW